MKAVMYHYVQPTPQAWPAVGCLDVKDFTQQLDYLLSIGRVPTQEEFLRAVRDRRVIDGALVLTFDDGLVDHFRYVLPELEKRDLWGVFYVSSGVYLNRRLLNVHRVHAILGAVGAQAALSLAIRLLPSDSASFGYQREILEGTYQTQAADAAVQLKRLLNFYGEPEWRAQLLDRMMAEIFERESDLVDSFYLRLEELRTMTDCGMLIGNHTESHPCLKGLSYEEQFREIIGAFEFLDCELGGIPVRTFCYPYGGRVSYDSTTLSILEESNCLFSFSVEARAVRDEDLRNRPHELPRYDCNSFPHGEFKSASHSGWGRMSGRSIG